MASGPTWNKHRGAWYVQYWDGKWHRRTVASAPPTWKSGDPEPRKVPPEAHAALAHWVEVEKAAKARQVAGVPASLADFLADHIATYRKDATRANVQAVVTQFLAWTKSRGIERFAQITAAVCGEWIDTLAQTDALATVRRKRAQLAVAWNRLKRRGRITTNPWDATEPAGRAAKTRGSWTKAEFARVLEVARPWLRDVLILGVNTGLRIEALMTLEWSDIRRPGPHAKGFGQVVVRKEHDKAGRGYDVPISRELHDLLARRFGRHDARFVLTGQFGKPLSGRNITDRAIRSACAKAGLAPLTSPNHHMRRTFGRWAILGHLTGKPVPLYVVSRWLGHSSIKTTLVYLDIREEDSTRFMIANDD